MTSPLEHLFGSKTRVRILNLFFADPSQSFYLREISRRIGIRLNSVRREMKNLSRYGILGQEGRKGLQKKALSKKFFTLNTESPIYGELKTLLLKGHLFLENDLVKTIGKLGPVFMVVLSGVFINEKETPIDLFIVGNLSNERLSRQIKNFEKRLGLEIRYTLLSRAEYKYRKLIADNFLYSLFEHKHIVALDKLEPKS